MNIIDLIIIVFLIVGAALGFKNGAIKTLVSFVGTFVIIILAFMFKDVISTILYENLPFFGFWGVLKGVQVINIVFYEIIAFLLVFGVLSFLLHILIVVTGLFEKILKMTVILSLPSKIIGIFVGLLQYYVYIFIVLFVLSLPMFHMNEIEESKYANMILNETPVISDYSSKSVAIYNEVYDVVKERNNKTNEQLNKEVMEVMLKNKFITYESAKYLIESNKVYLDDKTFIENYK